MGSGVILGHFLVETYWILDRKLWILLDFYAKPQLWQAVDPSSRGLWRCWDMFLISASRDLTIPGHLMRWYSRHAFAKNKNLEGIFRISQTWSMDRPTLDVPSSLILMISMHIKKITVRACDFFWKNRFFWHCSIWRFGSENLPARGKGRIW